MASKYINLLAVPVTVAWILLAVICCICVCLCSLLLVKMMRLNRELKRLRDNDAYIALLEEKNSQLKDAVNKIEGELSERQIVLDSTNKTCEEYLENLNKLKQQTECLERELQAQELIDKENKSKIAELERTIEELQRQIDEEITGSDILGKRIGSLMGGFKNISTVLSATIGSPSRDYLEQEIKRSLSIIENYITE